MRNTFALAALLGVLAGPASAQTIIYLNFDEQEDSTVNEELHPVPSYANQHEYIVGSNEIGLNLPPPYHELNLRFEMKGQRLRDLWAISDPDYDPDDPEAGDPPPLPDSFPSAKFGPTPDYDGPKQGGRALILDQEPGEIFGVRIVSDNGIAPSSFTMEAIWWTDDLFGQGNTVGIQSIMGAEAVGGQELGAFFVRTVYVGGQQFMDYWTDHADDANEGIRVIGPTAYPVSRLVHDAFVFEFNPDNPAACTLRAYRDGVPVTVAWSGTPYDGQTAVPYNAFSPRPAGPGLIPTSLFGTRGIIDLRDPGTGAMRMIAVGYNSSNDPDSDIRGLRGGIDAFALTMGVLTPDNFVLPSGTPIPFPESDGVDSWSIF